MTVVPTGKKLPAGMPARETLTVQLSLASATPSWDSPIIKPHEPVVPGGVPAVTSAGAVMVGGVVSLAQVSEFTLILCEHELDRPPESVTVQVITVKPIG